eukprot:3494326-Rhodomonas_salina.1
MLLTDAPNWSRLLPSAPVCNSASTCISPPHKASAQVLSLNESGWCRGRRSWEEREGRARSKRGFSRPRVQPALTASSLPQRAAMARGVAERLSFGSIGCPADRSSCPDGMTDVSRVACCPTNCSPTRPTLHRPISPNGTRGAPPALPSFIAKPCTNHKVKINCGLIFEVSPARILCSPRTNGDRPKAPRRALVSLQGGAGSGRRSRGAQATLPDGAAPPPVASPAHSLRAAPRSGEPGDCWLDGRMAEERGGGLCHVRTGTCEQRQPRRRRSGTMGSDPRSAARCSGVVRIAPLRQRGWFRIVQPRRGHASEASTRTLRALLNKLSRLLSLV